MDQFDGLVEKLVFDGTLDKMNREHDKQLSSDPVWISKNYFHIKTLIAAWAHGIISADSYFYGYKLPPDFELIVNYMAFSLWKKFGEEVPKVSLYEMKHFYKNTAMELPQYRKWNEWDGGVVEVTTRYSPTSKERSFVDLDVPPHNACIFLRNETRYHDTFDRKFDEFWAKGRDERREEFMKMSEEDRIKTYNNLSNDEQKDYWDLTGQKRSGYFTCQYCKNLIHTDNEVQPYTCRNCDFAIQHKTPI